MEYLKSWIEICESWNVPKMSRWYKVQMMTVFPVETRRGGEPRTSGVSAAAGKAGSSISTFRDKFGEDQGG